MSQRMPKRDSSAPGLPVCEILPSGRWKRCSGGTGHNFCFGRRGLLPRAVRTARFRECEDYRGQMGPRCFFLRSCRTCRKSAWFWFDYYLTFYSPFFPASLPVRKFSGEAVDSAAPPGGIGNCRKLEKAAGKIFSLNPHRDLQVAPQVEVFAEHRLRI